MSELGAIRSGAESINAATNARSTSEQSVILLLLVGGPSQLETWDPKPDAPAEMRGPFGTISTRCPGVRISEHLPRMAARMDQVCRCAVDVHDAAPIHEIGYQLLKPAGLRGRARTVPHIGSVIARLQGPKTGLPPFVVVPGPIGHTGVDIPRGQAAGWLGSRFDPFHLAALRPVSSVSKRRPSQKGPGWPLWSYVLWRELSSGRRLVESGVRGHR